MQAIHIIRSEHQSLAAVLLGMLYLVRQMRYGEEPSFDALNAMVDYLHGFTERVHHPKEDEYLFRSVQARNAAASTLIDRLKAEHRAGADKLRRIEQALAMFREQGNAQLAAFSGAIADYAALQWAHAHAEENELIPLAETFLPAADWDTIDAAFVAHTDPLGAEYQALFRRIVEVAPAPLGYGARARSHSLQNVG